MKLFMDPRAMQLQQPKCERRGDFGYQSHNLKCLITGWSDWDSQHYREHGQNFGYMGAYYYNNRSYFAVETHAELRVRDIALFVLNHGQDNKYRVSNDVHRIQRKRDDHTTSSARESDRAYHKWCDQYEETHHILPYISVSQLTESEFIEYENQVKHKDIDFQKFHSIAQECMREAVKCIGKLKGRLMTVDQRRDYIACNYKELASSFMDLATYAGRAEFEKKMIDEGLHNPDQSKFFWQQEMFRDRDARVRYLNMVHKNVATLKGAVCSNLNLNRNDVKDFIACVDLFEKYSYDLTVEQLNNEMGKVACISRDEIVADRSRHDTAPSTQITKSRCVRLVDLLYKIVNIVRSLF